MPSNSIGKYNLLQKVDTLFGNCYRPGKVSRLLRVQELWYRKCILYRKKANVYHKLERKGKSMMASASKDQIPRLKMLGNWKTSRKSLKNLKLMATAPPSNQKTNLESFAQKFPWKSNKHSIRKPNWLNFPNFSTIFCPRLSEEIHFHS